MKSTILKICCVVIIMMISMTATGQCADFRFPVGLVFASGVTQVVDKMKENFFLDEDYIWPAGVAFNPYLEFGNGLGIGASLGPYIFMFIESRYEDDSFSYIIPVGLDLRYTFLKKSDITPYVRAGFRYPIAGGDYFQSGKIGAFGGIGVEFWRTKRISMGLEISYDDSKMEIKAGGPGARPNTREQEVRPGGFMFGVFAVF
ncbi:MAG: outer membrane beta-barrel protein [Deltaproteobacteria bacterium]|nr:outer membrane beta-barrel protein [Deltaproteobacteria bacterium]